VNVNVNVDVDVNADADADEPGSVPAVIAFLTAGAMLSAARGKRQQPRCSTGPSGSIDASQRGEDIMQTIRVLLAPCTLAALLATSAAGCDDEPDETGATTAPTDNVEASAALEAKSGSTVQGVALFIVEGDMVTAFVEVTGAPPGEHAVHIHEHPDCTAHDAESAGGHWNPTMQEHGKWGSPPFHLGDIGNMTVDPEGKGRIQLPTDLWTVGTGKENDIVGHSMMVHADPDDFVSQPSGNAGARIACGVIQKK
jgi:Cu-Zn family superoxide dismutase